MRYHPARVFQFLIEHSWPASDGDSLWVKTVALFSNMHFSRKFVCLSGAILFAKFAFCTRLNSGHQRVFYKTF